MKNDIPRFVSNEIVFLLSVDLRTCQVAKKNYVVPEAYLLRIIRNIHMYIAGLSYLYSRNGGFGALKMCTTDGQCYLGIPIIISGNFSVIGYIRAWRK